MILGPFQFQVDDFDLIPPWVEPTGKDFEAQILFATETVTAPLNPQDLLVVHALNKSQDNPTVSRRTSRQISRKASGAAT